MCVRLCALAAFSAAGLPDLEPDAELVDRVLPVDAGPLIRTKTGNLDSTALGASDEFLQCLTDKRRRCTLVEALPVVSTMGVLNQLAQGPTRALGQIVATLQRDGHLDVRARDEEAQCSMRRLRHLRVVDHRFAEVGFQHVPEVGVEVEHDALFQDSAVEQKKHYLVLAPLDVDLVLLPVDGDDELEYGDLALVVEEEEVAERRGTARDIADEARRDARFGGGVHRGSSRVVDGGRYKNTAAGRATDALLWHFCTKKSIRLPTGTFQKKRVY